MRPGPSEHGPEVCVLGAGIVGICTALSLAEKGLRVRLVDRAAPGQATSFGNAGVISPWSVVPQSMPGLWKKVPGMLLDPLGPLTIRPRHLPNMVGWGLRFLSEGRAARVAEISEAMYGLTHDCVDLYRRLLAGTGHEALLRDCWYIHATRNPQGADPDSLDSRMRRDKGAEVARLTGPDLQMLEPALSPEFKAALIIKGQARALSPGRLGTVLTEKFQAMGGVFVQEEVQAIRPLESGHWQYLTGAGPREVPKLVLAMGAWSAALLKPLGIRIPLQSERGYHVSFARPGVQLSNSVMDVDRHFVASTMENGLRVAGTAEFAGLDAPENFKRSDKLITLAAQMLPDLNTQEVSVWSGQRPSLPDSLPCIGEVAGFPGLVCAFGHSHYGLMMAPRTGVIAADIATGLRGNTDLSPYAVQRF